MAETTEGDRGDGGESGLAVAEVHPGNGRSGGRATRDDARLLDDVAPVLLTAATERGTISNSRNPQAGELLFGGCVVVNFHDDLGWDHSRLYLWPINANTWIVLIPDGDKYAEKFSDHSKTRVPPNGESETPEIGSVEFSRGWTLSELSELVREGRNLARCARTSMGLTYDRDPTMMCDLSGRLFNVPPVTLGERVKRRIVRKLPMWRPAPANPPAPSRDLTTHVGTSLERRAPRQRTPRVRSDRVISVSDHVWVSMETDRIGRLKFGSVVALPDDVLVRGARGLMLLPGGGYVQRIPLSDLATFVDRAVDGKLPSPGDLRNIRD